ncbi:MAG: hypothetical protein AAFU67_04025 [Bacteroidota bacterium]
MKKIDISASIRSYLGLDAKATDAEVHQKMQEQTDAKASEASTPTAAEETPAETTETTPPATPEASTEAEGLVGLIKQLIDASAKEVKAEISSLNDRLTAIEAQPGDAHTEGEQKTEDLAAQPSWMSDPVNQRAEKFSRRKQMKF